MFDSTGSKAKLLTSAAAIAFAMSSSALAQGAAGEADEGILVIGTSPLLGLGVNADKVPANVRAFSAGDRGFLNTLEGGAGSLTLSHAQNNPFQPNIVYRGFEASPLNGVAQGMAVYVNGSRFNQPFGDTVNWDLIPDIAVSRMNLEGANAVFGLNALGGSLSMQMKDGFTYDGLGAEIEGGSFGRVQGALQYGINTGPYALYVAGSGLTEDGWRDFSPSDLRQFYGDVGWRGARGEVHFNITAADNDLTGNGISPVELLNVRREAVFTNPDNTQNEYYKFAVSGSYFAADDIVVQINAHYSDFVQKTLNGDAADAGGCEDDEDFLCLEDGDALIDSNGDQIPNFVTDGPYADFADEFEDAEFDEGGPYAFINRTSTKTDSYGVSLQLTSSRAIAEHENHFVAGASVDRGDSVFRASTEIATLSLDRGFEGPAVLIDMPGGPITPVHLNTTNTYYGVYASNIFDVTPDLSLTLSGRFNSAKTVLRDQIGTALNGEHSYDRFNPGVGLTYRISPQITAYARYTETNRVPTPAELSCADENAPCTLANFFIADPPLNQVVSHSTEFGVRGRMAAMGGRIEWNLGLFNTDNDDDIILVPSSVVGRAYFRNADGTRRRGVEAGIQFNAERVSVFADYAYVDATFRSTLMIGSPNNPAADDDGNIAVVPGDRLPGVAPHTVKFGAEFDVLPNWSVGAHVRTASGQYMFGDEGNDTPKVPGYTVVNADTDYRITDGIQLFARIDNLFDSKYETLGAFSETDEVPLLEVPNADNPRAFSPAPPFAIYGGLRLRF